MGRETKITCGVDVYSQRYFTLNIHKVSKHVTPQCTFALSVLGKPSWPCCWQICRKGRVGEDNAKL